jgi:hypothetical protein
VYGPPHSGIVPHGEQAMSQTIIRFAQAHGFEAEMAGDAVAIWIPTWNRRTQERGMLIEHVTSMAEARIALGY